MIIRMYLFKMCLLCSFFTGFGQTTLLSGDIAIIGIDTSDEDFMFVTFVPLSAGTEIYFTDEEADGDYTVGEGEGTVLYTAPVGGVVAGTVISYITNESSFDTTIDGDIALSNNGDGLIAYQGSSVGIVTTFLHAVGETIVEIGAFPDDFSNYVVLGGDDAEYYNLRIGESVATYFYLINNSSNWSTSGSGVAPFNLTNFTFGGETIETCLTPFISEYLEGTSNNKYIEIYNPTNETLTLTDNYFIQIYSNGNNSFKNISLIGTIEPYGAFVISHYEADLAISTQQISTSLNFNGNDAVALANTETIIDVVGEIGNNTPFGEDTRLKRKSNILNPTLNFDTSEWDVDSSSPFDISSFGYHLSDCGLICPLNSATIWNGVNWSDGNPDSSKVAIINGDYNTLLHGNILACSLVVYSGFTLTVSSLSYVEIENSIFVNGSITVETQGSFIQNSDTGIFKTIFGGIARVNKTTAPVNAWYEYTYWSSPVANETVGVALAQAPSSRRFWYKAQNYLDATAEIDNNNATIPGQDDIDDNGDDWQYANSEDIMIPGVGYAATQSASLFTGIGSKYNYSFTGNFNNGIITVPVYRNDAEMLDANWNFIGNPYPSAIDVDAFFNENVYGLNIDGVLDGAIYLWSQNTSPSSTLNGNEQLNFAQSDYAIINGIGSTAAQNPGGDGVLPNKFIPSCQGFFVSVSNDASTTSVSGTIKMGDVVFNNSMRVTGNNTQFFKNEKLDKKEDVSNKIWINLTSNNGVFNQLLVGYVDGATDGLDASFYDAVRNSSTNVFSIIFTMAEESFQKLAIQGKSINSLNIDEDIPIGFYTSIETSTNYSLEIERFEGSFFNENTIYLEDSLLGVIHNLSASNYSFTSEVGEFNDRFKIVFANKTLSNNEFNTETNQLQIIELENGDVKFKVNNNLSINEIEIVDFLGRILYQFKVNDSEEVYNISKLNQPIYLAKVTLSNGQVIVKKAIKKIN